MINMSKRLQSAMEYLMTYGWAILVIAVVLGVLYSLGVFSPSNFAPKAQPGSCQVFRPNGPGTNYDINLEGICSSELPQYVAEFNGQTSYINIANEPNFPSGNDPITMTGWMYISNYNRTSNYGYMFLGYGIAGNCGNHNYFSVRIHNNSGTPPYYAQTDEWCDAISNPTAISNGAWYFIAETYSTSIYTIYVGNGGSIATATENGTANILTNPQFVISPNTDAAHLYGYISNVQLYNSSLDASSITALYDEGIGGAPISIENLIAWYPLNGNANDYSGNNNNGVPNDVQFTGTWQEGYTAP